MCRDRSTGEISVFSAQFCRETKTALKIKSIKNKVLFMLQMYVLHMYYAIHATMNYYYLTEYLHKKSNYV